MFYMYMYIEQKLLEEKKSIAFVTRLCHFFKEWCKSKGSYLAELNTKEENNEIH